MTSLHAILRDALHAPHSEATGQSPEACCGADADVAEAAVVAWLNNPATITRAALAWGEAESGPAPGTPGFADYHDDIFELMQAALGAANS